MGGLLSISLPEAAATVIATAGMYVAMLLLVRLLGQRIVSSMSSFDFAAVIAFGSVIGRAALGDAPRLEGGLVALATLVLVQAIVGSLRLTKLGSRAVTNRPVLLMDGPKVVEANLQRCHVSLAELHSRLRQSGVRHRDEVGAVIFEPSGTISVLLSGRPIDTVLLDGVVGNPSAPPSS